MVAWLAVMLLVGCSGDASEDSGGDTDVVDSGAVEDELPETPGTETVSVSFDVDVFSGNYDSPTVPAFDTRDGALELTAMTLQVEHSVAVDIWAENGSDFALEAGDYTWDWYFNTLMQLGPAPENETEDNGPPFLGPGGFWIQLQEPLAASDDASAAGEDYWADTVTQDITFEYRYTSEEQRFLDAMTDTGDQLVVIGGFTEVFFNWAEGMPESSFMEVQATALQYTGSITVTYEYDLAD